jgi:hypothetical protein
MFVQNPTSCRQKEAAFPEMEQLLPRIFSNVAFPGILSVPHDK